MAERVPVDAVPYDPPDFTHPAVAASPPWADPPTPPADVGQRITLFGNRKQTLEAAGLIGADGRPCNPCGRTGIRGRGLLGKWGPNNAADPLVTRFRPDRPGVLQIVCVKRADTGEWALPGGMTEGKSVSDTLLAEFKEEALRVIEGNPDLTDQTLQRLDELFAQGGDLVYAGVVGKDPRNTDNSWVETVAYHFHITDPVLKMMPLRPGDDAAGVRWVDVTPEMNLYANHTEFVALLQERFNNCKMLSQLDKQPERKV